MSLLLQISDTHFGTEQPAVVDALVALAAQLKPSLTVLSGDITQRARPAQFQAARDFVNRLGVPVIAIPGNHDIPLIDLLARLRAPYSRYQAAFGADLEPTFSSPDLLVVCVNTTRFYRHKHGEVSTAQIARVEERLSRATPLQLRVVVAHQPMAVQRAQDAIHLVRGHAQALQRWAGAGADIVLGGHIHLPYVQALNDTPRPIWVVQAGTAVSSRVRPGVPNSVNVLSWGALEGAASHCKIAQWDFDRDQQQFVCARVTEVKPRRSEIISAFRN
jgi:3',5'-cyclic AMP phosphodiesterase CpdA